MSLPTVCVRCAKKSCEDSAPGQLRFCEYDVAYYNDGITVLRREAPVSLRMVCTNLRHELHHVLNLIVEQATVVDPSLSIRRIDLDKPASKILAATIIIDHFIQMLTGVYEFHPPAGGEQLTPGRSLAEIVRKYFSIYSIVKGARRSSDLKLAIDFDNAIMVPHYVDTYEYLTSILMDNAWKYSVADTTVVVRVQEKGDDLADISFTNASAPIPQDLDIFGKGAKGSYESEGFGYGLYWATVLLDYYNRQLGRTENPLQLVHSQTIREDGLAMQQFTLVNADIIRKE